MKYIKNFLVLGVFLSNLLLFSNLTFAFSDISNHLHEQAISYIAEQGYIEGYIDNTYRPDQKINRAEFTKIIIGAAFSYSPNTDTSSYDIYSRIMLSFTDIEDNAWYNPYLRVAIQKRVLEGYDDATFRPANNINLAEALKIILNAYEKDTSTYSNDPWYYPYLGYAKDNGLLNNIENEPAHLLTRGEMAELIYQIEQNLTNNEQENEDSEESVDAELTALRNDLLDILNEERSKNNLPLFFLNTKLNLAAQNHAEDMEENEYFSHDSLDGRDPFDRIDEVGYSYSYAAENIAQGHETAKFVFDSWMASPGHEANIMNENYTEIGIGYTEEKHYWVLVFGGTR
jgi:uncharacterized protein YkwD